MKQKRMMALLLSGAMVISGIMAGCGGGSSNAGSSESAESGQAGNQTEGSADSITLWMHNGPAFVEATNSLAEKFEKETGIHVDVQSFPYDVMSQKMKTSFAAGNEPDIIQAFGSWLPTYINQGELAQVPDELVSKFETDFFEGAVEGLEKDGAYYGVPIELQCEYGLFYVPEKVEAAGIDGAPKTFEEVLQVARNSVEFSGDILNYAGLDFINGDNVAQLFMSWVLQQGGDYWDEDGVHVNFQTDEAKAAWQQLVDLLTTDKVTDTQHITADMQSDTYFFNGKSAQLIKGSWASALGDELNNDNWEFVFLPPFAGDVPTFVAETGWTYVVSEDSKNKDNAFKFVEFCLEPENAREFNLTTATIPSLKSLAEDPQFTDAEQNIKVKDQFQYLQYSQNVGPVQDMDFVKKTFMDTLTSQAAGETTTEKALESMETEINQHIDSLLEQAG